MLIVPLLLPIALCTITLFFASFLSWMVLPFHRKDWVKMPNEDTVWEALRTAGVGPGNYMVPGVCDHKEMQTEAHQAKVKRGPVGVVTIFPGMNMGRNLGLTVLYFLVTSICLAYLARLGLPLGAPFLDVFRFIATAAFMTYLSGIISHAIWFHCRIVGHIIESVAYAAIVGVIFAFFWPGA